MTSSLVIGPLSWSGSGMTSILASGLGRRLDLLLFLLSNIGSGTRGHQGHMPLLGKDLPFSAPPLHCLVRWPFWPYPIAGTRAVMAQRSLNMASGAPKTLKPGILAASSPNINLSTNVASEAISEHLILKITHHHRCPPHWKYLPLPIHMALSKSFCVLTNSCS